MRTIIVTLLLLASIPLLACPTSLVWIPSTDIQTTNVWHLYTNTLIFTNGGSTPPFVDEGILYGVSPRIEVGADGVSPFYNIDGKVSNPLWFNGKLQLLAASDKQPFALAVGAYGVSPQKSSNVQIFYGVGSYTFYGIRLTGGAYDGNSKVLGDDNKGYLAGIDKTIGKWWFAGDFQSGKNAFGCWNAGIGYNFTDKIQGIVGYDHYNSPAIIGAKESVNLQVGINL